MLELAEIFSSLQGEGPFSGRPAVFVRLSRCIEPYCSWCDTKHAWQQGEEVTPEEIIRRVSIYSQKLIVITGGEPFLQWNSGLKELEKSLLGSGFEIQYETSGKIPLPENSNAFIVCSPKWIEREWQFDSSNGKRVNAFKFVADNNFAEIQEFVQYYRIPQEKVWIMPLGSNRAEQLKSMPAVWQFCIDHGFTLSPRLHILTFDQKQKV